MTGAKKADHEALKMTQNAKKNTRKNAFETMTTSQGLLA
jgi:hypothetical protein